MDGGPILLQKSSGTTMSENCSSQTAQSGIESVAGQDCSSCLDHLKLIRKQFSRIELLENEISILRCERDALMFENEKVIITSTSPFLSPFLLIFSLYSFLNSFSFTSQTFVPLFLFFLSNHPSFSHDCFVMTLLVICNS